VKTVAYYLRSPNAPSSSGSSLTTTGAQSGLMRREMDRAMTRYATDSGQSGQLDQASKVLAPEVTSLEFQYHDGQAWNTSWDSEERGGLPVAIEVRVGIASAKSQQRQRAQGLTAGAPFAPSADDLVYRLVVRLPAAQATGDTATDSQNPDSESSSSSGTGNSSGAGSSPLTGGTTASGT
jgi:hypothetical protein